MSNLSALRDRLLFALNDRKGNCEHMARAYLADNLPSAAAQCRAAAGAVQECIDAVTNIMSAPVEVEPEHLCGSGGFGYGLDDRCPGCEWENAKRSRLDSTTKEKS